MKLSTALAISASVGVSLADFMPEPRRNATPDLTRIELAELKRERKAKRRMK